MYIVNLLSEFITPQQLSHCSTCQFSLPSWVTYIWVSITSCTKDNLNIYMLLWNHVCFKLLIIRIFRILMECYVCLRVNIRYCKSVQGGERAIGPILQYMWPCKIQFYKQIYIYIGISWVWQMCQLHVYTNT